MPENKSPISDKAEQQVKAIVIDSEYTVGLSNKDYDNEEFQSYIDMFECERTEKNADWRSDISIPQFFSLIVTQASNDAAPFFSSRDFVESYVMEGKKTAESNADERLINRTLNQKHLHMYHKYMRLRLINYMKGECYARLWWEKKTKIVMRPDTQLVLSGDTDIYGNSLTDRENQTPAVIEENIMVEDEVIVHDRFNFEVIDPRNVITDNAYSYSLEDKAYVILRSEVSLDKLQEDAEQNEYFNLDQLKDANDSGETETARETTNLNDRETIPDKTPTKLFDKIERFGKFWVIVKEKEADDYPTKVESGYDDSGKKKENAEFIECLITFVKDSSKTVMIGFQPQKCRASTGESYRPVIRGLHYIHPTEDSGMGDGKPQKELQIAIDDTFNLNNDRSMMAAAPVFKMKKYGNEDNATIRFEPEHVIELDDPKDLEEIRIDDNINGSHVQIGFLKSMSEQAFAQSPSTMGMLPQDSSVTATAIAGADARANVRSNYKSLTWEYTFLNPFYWMISQLTWQYVDKEDTALKLLGDKLLDFNPDGDYYWKPVSQSIETEYSRGTKIKQLTNVMGLVVQVPNPKAAQLFNYMMAKVLSLMGDENEAFANYLLDPNAPPPVTGQQTAQQGQATSNQAGLPQSGIEEGARENFNEVSV